MKSRSTAILAAVLAALMVTACKKPEPSTPTEPNPKAATPAAPAEDPNAPGKTTTYEGSTPEPAQPAFDAEAHARLARRVGDGAVTLVRDRAGLLPLRLTPATRVLHVVLLLGALEVKRRSRDNDDAAAAAAALGTGGAPIGE